MRGAMFMWTLLLLFGMSATSIGDIPSKARCEQIVAEELPAPPVAYACIKIRDEPLEIPAAFLEQMSRDLAALAESE